ncbi:MAG: hypothetical protein ACRDTE_30285 [Pseudonocardiaceae bacterium]
MTAVANDEPPSLAELATYQEDGRAWVVTDKAGPSNAPYYQRLGFQVMAQAQITDGHCRIREHEEALGLARPRVVMQRPVGDQDQTR